MRQIVKTALKALMTVALATVFCVFIHILGFNTDFFSPFKQAFDSYDITDLYMGLHKKQEIPSYDGASVVLMDISSCNTRSEIAQVVDRINAAGPRLVAMDVIFPHAVSSDPEGDSLLVASLSNVADLVVATEMRPVSETEYLKVSSFFVEELDPAEGVVTLPGGVIREWNPLVAIGDEVFPSFTKVITDKLEVPVPETVDPQLINYAIYDPLVLDAEGIWDPEYIKGQVVLLGDVADVRDTYLVPVNFRSSARQSGVYVHKQILQTCFSQEFFRYVPSWCVYLVSLLILFCFAMLMCPLMDYTKRCRDSNDDKFNNHPQDYTLIDCIKGFVCGHIVGVIQIVLIVLSVIAGYLLFWVGGYVFDLTFLIAGFVLMYVAHRVAVSTLKFITEVCVIIKNRKRK